MAFVLLVATAPARADVIVFNDLADTLSVSGSARLVFNCPAGTQTCTASLSAPAGTTFNGIDASLEGVNIADPGGLTLSDTLHADPPILPNGSVSLSFSSDLNETGPLCATIFHGCQITEDGTVQPVGSVFWSNGSSDVIAFQSDVDVPEPSSWLLLATAFALLRTAKCRIRPGR